MSVYYISVCHTCEVKGMWPKITKEHAELQHKNFHTGHDTDFGTDMDEEFYNSIPRAYKDLDIFDYEDLIYSD